MKSSIFARRVVLLAAVAGVELMIASGARGQYQIDNSRVNDANNRIGSGGYNTGAIPAPGTVSGNQIVTGNVTGGKAFRGPVGYSAPNDFAGQTATGDYDQFIRDSSGAPVSYNHTNTNYSGSVQPFYSSVSTPPTGYVSTPGRAGFTAPMPAQYNSLRFDERLGVLTDASPDSFVPQRGQLLIPGPVDASQNQTFYSASPLYGVRQFNLSDPGAAAILENAGALSGTGRSGLSDDQVLKMRRELAPTLNTPDLQPGGSILNPNSTSPGQAQPLTGQVPTAFDAPDNSALSGSSFNNAYASTANNLSTGQNGMNKMIVPPTAQSSQYAEMRRRLDRYSTQHEKTPEEMNQEFQTQLRAAEKKQGAQIPDTKGKTTESNADRLAVPQLGTKAKDIAEGKTPLKEGSPTYVTNPTGGVTAAIPSNPDREPVEVHSLATGVSAPGLHGLLEKSEALMRDGKFDSAITEYQNAGQVAPNNPMILLGQANAELGGQYYARAENHLRQAFLIDPTLLMARYDLHAMMGDKRLEEIVVSLKAIAAKEKTQTRPAFLLAYIAYNMHDRERAASYLDLAEQRSQSFDPVFQLMRMHWNLPAHATTPAAGK
ncbi:MAG TPA: hypothetical protein VFE58_09180 [Tepidisphaeraceae bacterium]|nr:hypothetical protein [Tepidisphaeraceae bacterium]